MTATQSETSTELARNNMFTNSELRTLDMGALVRLAGERGIVQRAADVLGDGFSLTKDKDQLVGQRLVIVSYSFTDSDKYDDGGAFVTLRCVTERGKFIVNDGSTGIYRQLLDMKASAEANGDPVPDVLLVDRGLRKSEYETIGDNGKPTVGVTYYLDTATN